MTFHMSLRRKIAIASWSAPKEGNIYGKISMDMGNVLKYVEYLRQSTKEKITVTHIVGRAAGLALAQCPDLNGRIFLGTYYPHDTVDLAFLVSLEGGKDLAKFKICDVDKKTTVEIARELREGAERLRQGEDQDFERPKGLIKTLPTWIIRQVLFITGYLTGCAGIDVSFLGLKKYPFGSCIITSVGMFGLDEGYAPPTPFARVPIYIAIPEIKQRPVAIDNKVVIRPMLDITATIDHRFLDGHRGAMIAKMMREYMQNPWVMDGLPEPPENWQESHIDQAAPICDKKGAKDNKAMNA